MNDIHTTRQVCRPAEKMADKKTTRQKQFWLHLCKLEICTYISLAAIYGLTAITKILVAGWKHASFLCYSMGARWFLRFLGPKLELPSMSAYSPSLRRLWLQCRNFMSCRAGKTESAASEASGWACIYSIYIYTRRPSSAPETNNYTAQQQKHGKNGGWAVARFGPQARLFGSLL